ncbi:MAG: hypothetical protein ACOYJY_02945 [Acutalibacteraceae bacterium]|jgi:hypothetical protein
MKKRLVFLLIACFLFFILIGCRSNSKEWKQVEIADCGTIEIPKEWVKSNYNGKIYLADTSVENTSCTIYFFQLTDFEQDVTVFSDNIRFVKYLDAESEGYSNSAGIAKASFFIDGKAQDLYCFYLGQKDGSDVDFYALDTNISKDTIRKIAQSFKMNW